ncbi:hypothetical protein [Teredinibacter turnerae]|uniref:hypothetical protein n=1 Tax=Teredinibacter turnerae TaxID=2426 RepID=UPI00036BC2A1|nr:hypothetical protein [Teredinibacter turnerae]
MHFLQTIQDYQDKKRHLADELVETHGDPEDRERVFQALLSEIDFYPGKPEYELEPQSMTPYYGFLSDLHETTEYERIQQLIEQLHGADFAADHWRPFANELREAVYQHLAEEEARFTRMLGSQQSANAPLHANTSQRAHIQQDVA